MKIKAGELKKALDEIKTGISIKEWVPFSNRFVFSGGKIYTFNDEIIAWVDNPLEDLTGAVIAQEFLDILDKYKDDELLVMKVEEEMLVIHTKKKGRKTTVGLNLINEVEDMPLEEVGNLEDIDWKSLPKEFKKGLEIVIPSASKDSTMAIIQCVHIKKNYMESTDNFNVVRYTLPKKSKMKELSIIRSAATEVNKKDVTKYALTSNSWVLFKTPTNVVIGVRNFDEQVYPELDSFFDTFKGDSITIPKVMKEIITKAQIFLKDMEYSDSGTVMLESKKDWLILKAEGATGFVKEEVKEKDLPPFSMDINVIQLSYLLTLANEIEFGKETARIITKDTIYISSLR